MVNSCYVISNLNIKNLAVLGVNCLLIFCYLIVSQKFAPSRLSRLMNTAMFLLLIALGAMTIIYAGGVLFGSGLFKIAVASIIKKIPYLLLLAASSSLVFTMIALDFWKSPTLIILNQAENIKRITLMALSQNALLLTWLILNQYSITNNFINIAAPIITTTIFYQSFYQYLPAYLQRVSFLSLRIFFVKQFKKVLWIASPHKRHEVINEPRFHYCGHCDSKDHGIQWIAAAQKARFAVMALFWQNFSKNTLNLLSKKALYSHNKLFALDFVNLYNEHSNQAKIISLASIINKLRQHKINIAWLGVLESMLNFLQKFVPEINAASSQKMVSGFIGLFQKLVIGIVDDDNAALFIIIKKIVATLLELNSQIKNNNNVDVYVKMHMYLAIQGIIKQLGSDKLYIKQDTKNTNELISDLGHALCEQAKPDYFNINYANIVMSSSLDNIPVIIKRLPNQKYQNDDCAVFTVENIKIANKTYQVTLTAKMDIRLYELDYLDWEVGLDFKDISITDQDGAKIINNEYKQVLTVLKKLPKFLGRELTRVDAIAAEVFTTVSDLIPALGKVQELIVVPIINSNSDILTEDFLSNLYGVTQKFSPSQKHYNIINNYKNILLKSTKYDKSVALEKQIQRADDLLAQSSVLLNSNAKLHRA